MVASFVPALLGILILVWWLTFSRATWGERLFGLTGVIAAIAAAVFLADKSMLGPPIIVLTVPTALAAFAVALILMSRTLVFRRTVIAVVCAFLLAGFSTLLKNDGAKGDFTFGFDWRWQPTPEELFLTNRKANPPPERPLLTKENFANPAWPGFRGPKRDGIQRGLMFESDWQRFPPKELWRIKWFRPGPPSQSQTTI